MLIIKNGCIHNAIDPRPFEADILVENGKITRIGPGLDLPGAAVYDAAGLDVYPGFIDAHTHIGMFGLSGEATKDDVENYDRCTPNHRALDIVNPEEPTFPRALRAGVTCVCVGPGSVGCMAGTHAAIKTGGTRTDDMVVKDPVAMKVAFGENPKRAPGRVSSRATVAATIRDALLEARDYWARKDAAGGDVTKMPRYDANMEALLPVLRREIPLKAHVQRKDDIFTAIRVAKECQVDLTLEHVHNCGGAEEVLAWEGYPIVVGPYFSQPKKDENARKDPATAVALLRAGCSVSVMTDAPVVDQSYLPLCAGLLMREGATEFEALQTITINPARHLRIEDRVGSIEVGKDADLVITRGCPMAMTVKPEAVFLNGEKVFEKN